MNQLYNIKNFLFWIGFFLLIMENGCNQTTSELVANNSIPETIDFNFHVRPILSDRCYACHGPDENALKGDLRLDLEASALAPLDSLETRFAIVPGDLEKSQLFHRIATSDPEELMPPPESNLELSPREIEILKRWIEQGAKWKPHWAYTPPQKEELPKVNKSEWVQNPIDNFILNRLEQEGLEPSQEATKEKLIRKLSFDLRGLPPSLQEIDDFLANNSPDAYEQLADDFLAQKNYGERMAMEWLDLARYADSHGYQDDIERSMWPWRDWVIKSFNENLPYDKFVSWQLAGDLLPDATYEQKLATGFNRNHKITQEVGVIDEEYRVTYVLDRVNTFSTAFMGLTVECAQCHDHKYDPISQKEYYQLFSFFNSVPERGRVDYGVEVAAPSLPLPDQKIEELRSYVKGLVSDQQTKLKQYASGRRAKGFDNLQLDTKNASISNAPKGLVAFYPLDYIENDNIQEAISGKPAEVVNELIPITGKFSGGMEFMGTNYANLSPTQSFNFFKPFTLSFWIKSLDGGIRGSVLTSVTNEDNTNFHFQVTNDKMLRLYWSNPKNNSRIQLLSKETLPENKWVQVTLAYNASGKGDEIKLYMDGNTMEVYVQQDDLRGTPPPSKKLLLGRNQGGGGLVAGQLDEFMFFNRYLDTKEVKVLNSYDPIQALLAKQELSESDKKRLFYYQLTHHNQEYQNLTQRLREYKIREGRTEDIIIKPTMVMADMDSARETFILKRGQYDAHGESVKPGTPKAVMAFDENYEKNRLGLAQWLFNPNNPLTARVAVNRYWQMVFGRGLVATPGDFGSQGTLPSHPALLDWLAIEFQESGWNVKQLIKTMVMSATYRQSVKSNDRLQQIDPENILLARGGQVRLSAEMVRDHALAVGGLLSKQLGGPSVKPYQPKGLWLEVASGNQSLRKYIQDHNDELYRRSLYTFWKRTLPPPSMTIFDAPSREQCTIKRGTTSTPMQALVLLNDPQFIEASRLLAARMLNEGGETLEERIKFAFRLATSRQPQEKEVLVLSDLFQKEQAEYEANPDLAEKLLSTGEYVTDTDVPPAKLAAYAVVANAILNTTEAIMKG
ncbi:DUF1553 domain-containing protein [Reichenbachiella sp. MALMAid0571]|uniref:DUF1553 domain-containing protein n=1 Tax=Reichenbachiella sp. MALMAid0571 TaxID=3143939 RepID=UPI0032DF4A6B